MNSIDSKKVLTEVEADEFARDDASLVLMYNLALMPSLRFKDYENYELYCSRFYQYLKKMM